MLPIDCAKWNGQSLTVRRIVRLPLGLVYIVLLAALWPVTVALNWIDGRRR